MKGERRPQALKGQGRKALEGTWRQRPSPKRASPRHFSSAEAKAIDLPEGLYPLGTLKGLTTYYVLFFIHQESRQVRLAGFTPYPDQEWMEQQARNMTMEEWRSLRGCRYLLHDRDAKFCESFRKLIRTGRVNPLRLPARSPNLNSYAERWVRSVREECLSRLILFGESSRRALQQYLVHYHGERNHQGKDNRILFPSPEARGRR